MRLKMKDVLYIYVKKKEFCIRTSLLSRVSIINYLIYIRPLIATYKSFWNEAQFIKTPSLFSFGPKKKSFPALFTYEITKNSRVNNWLMDFLRFYPVPEIQLCLLLLAHMPCWSLCPCRVSQSFFVASFSASSLFVSSLNASDGLFETNWVRVPKQSNGVPPPAPWECHVNWECG